MSKTEVLLLMAVLKARGVKVYLTKYGKEYLEEQHVAVRGN